MKKVLITGATGFIGRHTLPFFIDRGFEIHAITSKNGLAKTEGITWHSADLLDSKQIERVLSNVQPSHVLHLAWYAEPGKYWHAQENFRWVESSLQLLRAFKKYGGKRFVGAGTCAEYDWKYGYLSENISPAHPSTVYGVCKNTLRELLLAYNTQYGLSSAWGRIFYLYGPHEHHSRLVSSVILSLLKDKPANCTDGKQIRDFLYVKDVAKAFVLLVDSEVNGVFNVSSGDPVSVKELIDRIGSILKKKDLLNYGVIKKNKNDPKLIVGDNNRITDEFGWEPTYNLDDGINDTINWWKENIS